MLGGTYKPIPPIEVLSVPNRNIVSRHISSLMNGGLLTERLNECVKLAPGTTQNNKRQHHSPPTANYFMDSEHSAASDTYY